MIAFPVDLDWQEFLRANHQQDLVLLRRLGEQAERALDVVRFELCRFDVSDTLPGRAGSWTDSGPYCGSLLFDPNDCESWLIAGPTTVSSVVVRGIGLEIEHHPEHRLPYRRDGEVGAIALHGLSLFRTSLNRIPTHTSSCER